jgi:ATP diphosphatase
LAEVVAGINAKLVPAAPARVSATVKVSGVGQVLENWEKLKAAERGGSAKPDKGTAGQRAAGLAGAAAGRDLPAARGADRLRWPDVSGVRAKVDEEIAEVTASQGADDREDEVGDLLFAVVNWARWLGVEPEAALRRANGKFARRFTRWKPPRERRAGRWTK